MKNIFWVCSLILLFFTTNCGQKKSNSKVKQSVDKTKDSILEENTELGMRPITELFLDENSIIYYSMKDALKIPEEVENLKLIDKKLSALPDDISRLNNLIQLHLPYNKLSSLPADFFEKFPDLEVLDISHNAFAKLPASIFKLKKLRFLNVSGNNIQEIPEDLTELSNLQILNIGSNPIRQLPDYLFELKYLKRLVIADFTLKEVPTIFNQLENLEWLTLSNCKIDTFPAVFTKMPSLKYLNLAKNNIDSIPEAIESLKDLRNLDISANPIDTLPKAIYNKLNLKALNISNTKLKEIPNEIANAQKLIWLDITGLDLKILPEELSAIETLSTFILGNNKTLDINQALKVLSSFKNLEELKWVNMSSNTFVPVEISEAFENLSFVKRLDLNSNLLKNKTQAIEILAHLDHLEALNLSNCGIRNFTDDWKRLSKLKYLGLDIKNISNAEIEKLKQLLPDVEITDGSEFFDYRHYLHE